MKTLVIGLLIGDLICAYFGLKDAVPIAYGQVVCVITIWLLGGKVVWPKD